MRFTAFDADPSAMTDASDTLRVGAILEVTHTETGETRELRPFYVVSKRTNEVSLEPATVDEWGMTVTFRRMNVNAGEVVLGIQGVQVMPDDWLVVMAYEKPFINVLWIGFLIMTGGFGLAIARRWQDDRRKAGRHTQTA